MAAKIEQDNTQATARPPGNGRVTAANRSINRCAIDPRVMTLPHRMNNGIDRISSLSSPIHISSII